LVLQADPANSLEAAAQVLKTAASFYGHAKLFQCQRYKDGADGYADRDSALSLKNPLWACPGLCGLSASPIPVASGGEKPNNTTLLESVRNSLMPRRPKPASELE